MTDQKIARPADPTRAEESAPVDLGRALVEASLLRGDFVLSSGARSDYYLDKYRFETRPGLLRGIAAAMARLVPPGTDRLAGPELGAVAVAAALSLATDLPFIIVRRESKGYSTANLIEGELRQGDRVVVVEDVITSGAQAIRAAGRITDAGGRVKEILAVIDREEGGADRVAAAGYHLTTLFRRSSLGI